MALNHYRQREYQDSEGNRVSDRYSLYKFSEAKTLVLEKDLTLDEISLMVYSTPLYYWIIGEANNISDPFQKVRKGTHIKVPML